MDVIAPKYKTPSERASTGGKGIAKQRMFGGEALMGAPRPYSPTPVRIKPGHMRTAANNRRQAEIKAARRAGVVTLRAPKHVAAKNAPHFFPADRVTAQSSLRILIVRDYEENGYPDWVKRGRH